MTTAPRLFTFKTCAVAKLIQRLDNSPSRRAASVASGSRLHLSRAAVRQSCVCRSTAAVPRCSASEGEDFYEARFPSAPARYDAACDRWSHCEPGLCARRAVAPFLIRIRQPTPAERRRLVTSPRSRLRPYRAQGEAVQQAQDIVVTGTRIPQPNLTSAARSRWCRNQDIKLSGTDPHRGRAQPAAVGGAPPGLGPSERRDGHRGSRPSLPRLQAHPGADQRPPHHAGRSERTSQAGRHQLHPGLR